MSKLPRNFLTEEQYLELDRAAEYKSEFYDGEMFAMAGADLAHNRIVMNIGGAPRAIAGQAVRGAF